MITGSRKNKFITIILGLVLLQVLFVILYLLIEITVIPEVSFSVESGFYSNSFYLELKSKPGAKIYYTTDSSDPDENSTLYNGAICISDATENENVYSAIKDVTLDYRDDLLEQAGISYRYGYVIPEEPVDKITVIKAIAIDRSGHRGPIVTEEYGVGFDEKHAYDGMNIISVTTDPKNLFDYKSGIYVTGENLDDSLVNGTVITPITPNFGWWRGNYTQSGENWEKRAFVSFWNKDRNLLYQDELGLRIQGGEFSWVLK